MPNWTNSLTPQTWRFANPPVVLSGLEDLEVADAVQIHVGYGCWISNVVAHVGATHADGCLRAYWSARCTIEHCAIDGTPGVDNYGIETRAVSGLLVQNNSSRGVGTALNPSGSTGSVWAYNVMTNNTPFYSVILLGLLQHGGNPNMNLYEGNVSPAIGFDNTWGCSAYNTAFRSRAVGYDWSVGSSYGNQVAFADNVTNRHASCIGNVLGTTGVNTWYEDYAGSSGCHNSGSVYYLGYYDVGCQTPTDTGVRSTLIRAYNWTSATATNNGIVNDGYSSTDIPASYYLTSKPAFFGNLPWPPVDPASPAYSSSYTNIPAGFRDVFGIDPPSAGNNQAPVVMASVSTNRGTAPLTVSFSSSGSYDPEGVSLTYNWSFGDGATSTVANPSHTYTTNGAFSAHLSVSDGTNTTTSSNLTINVTVAGSNYPPVAVSSATPVAGGVPLVVSFSSTGSSDPEGAALTYSWVFGDGSTSTAANPSHTYQAAGNYTAQLTVSDGTNSVAATAITITVVNAASGLVAAYGFEEGSGTTVSDASGNGNTGTISGATWSTAGKYGNALSFNGSGAVASVPNSTSLGLSSAMTVEAWVYPTSVSGWEPVIYKYNDLFYLLGASSVATGPATGVGDTGTSGDIISSGSSLSANTWTHLAGTYNGATTKLYVNGVLVASSSHTGSIASSTYPLTIGGNTVDGNYFTGLIDEVRVYNQALSAAQIVTDMNTAISTTTVQLAAPVNLHVVSVGP